MKPSSFLRRLGVVVVAGVVLAGCAETRFVMATAKRLGDTNKSQGDYKVGKPYQVAGVWYYPSENWSYDETGIASWYGPNFHGKDTANGEVFDQWAVSAAHKTLPMPSLVRVTNLENGRSLVIRINDRGPFKPGRIIDLSRRSAQLLGTEAKGTARVRVQILAKESQAMAQRAKGGNSQAPIMQAAPVTPVETVAVELPPIETVRVEPLAPPTAPPPSNPPVSAVQVGDFTELPVLPTRIYIQAGAFSNKANAERVKAQLTRIGDVIVTPVPVGGRELFRVRLGPLQDVGDADRLLAEVVQAGYHSARTVVEDTAVD